ncbi:bacteriohemerythrin [Natronoflexus pectinivorans]|uniref:Hemerythrin n=1 Tax=Natronoflexus pectinivorans TaxID=682526 RepID=A0A4R2GNC8_9BACT|nr:bacteriohemerythrin [Natronoflexus pectinivorans]TCO10537.1 hemerythrin [Natronoflexus pectinivorans]
MIEWKKEYSIDVPQIDEEHKTLIKSLNEFYEGLRINSSKENLDILIQRLLKYAESHFSNEEKYMQSINYQNIEEHSKEHKEFMSKANDFYEKFRSGKMMVSFEVTNFIKDWIVHHILNEDMKLKN